MGLVRTLENVLRSPGNYLTFRQVNVMIRFPSVQDHSEFDIPLCFRLAVRLWATFLKNVGARRYPRVCLVCLTDGKAQAQRKQITFSKWLRAEPVISKSLHLPLKAQDTPAETSHQLPRLLPIMHRLLLPLPPHKSTQGQARNQQIIFKTGNGCAH